jgi:hypothetical protein
MAVQEAVVLGLMALVVVATRLTLHHLKEIMVLALVLLTVVAVAVHLPQVVELVEATELHHQLQAHLSLVQGVVVAHLIMGLAAQEGLVVVVPEGLHQVRQMERLVPL